MVAGIYIYVNITFITYMYKVVKYRNTFLKYKAYLIFSLLII